MSDQIVGTRHALSLRFDHRFLLKINNYKFWQKVMLNFNDGFQSETVAGLIKYLKSIRKS